jgi:PKD repeat protein
MSFVLGIMGVSLPLVVSPASAKGLTTVAAIAIVLLASNFTITDAQQSQQLLQQLLSSQPAAIQNGTTTLFESTKDSFRVQVPQAWIIHDTNNTGFALFSEVLQGYGILAQLCPQEQQEAAVPNASSTGNSLSTSSCEVAQEELIHILRFPNLGARLGFTSDDIIANTDNVINAILSYEIQKLEEVGYTDINIVNSTDTTVSVDISAVGISSNNTEPAATVPAKLVEMTYSTSDTPDVIKRGHFILTATNATPRNLGEITGYSVFYEGNSSSAIATGEAATITTIPPPVSQLFDSFELIVGEEVAQDLLATLAAQAEEVNQQQLVPANPLTVEMISNATEGSAPATFEFEADVTGGTEPYTIAWDFDDGEGEESDDEETVLHTFDDAGTYNVIVTASDNEDQSASVNMEITVEEPAPPGEGEEETECDPSYPDVCIPPPPPNLTCDDISARDFEVLPPDPHGLDTDSDGIGCESGANQPDMEGSENNSGTGNSGDLLDLLQ